MIVWMIGFLAVLFRNLYCDGLVWLHYRNTYFCSGRRQQIFEQVCQKLDITKGRVQLCEDYKVLSPFQMGIRKKKVYLPATKISDEELDVILCHELVHCKQNDVAWKQLTTIICAVHWFNPFAWWLKKIFNCWCEYACDYAACGPAGGGKHYFSTIITLQERFGKIHNPAHLQLAEDKHEIKRRVDYFMKCSAGVKKSKAKVKIVICSLLLLSVLSVGLGTVAFAEGYIVLFHETRQEVQEPVSEENEAEMEFIEYTATAAEFSTKVETGELASANSISSMGTFEWSVGDGVLMKSNSIYLEAGSGIRIHVYIEPSDLPVKMGLITPSGLYRYVTGSDSLENNFVIFQSGNYAIFVENQNGTAVEVCGVYQVD
ncbi:MAG: M56 family metallopeptidase [Lachnospiraceae bacterium]|nr:M56 family metallopeptidase [Lachnospiraceae bacterium]